MKKIKRITNKKIIIMSMVILIALLVPILSGCDVNSDSNKAAYNTSETTPKNFSSLKDYYEDWEKNKLGKTFGEVPDSRFYSYGNYYVTVYDKTTKVMYETTMADMGGPAFTMLVNADGSPRIYEGE